MSDLEWFIFNAGRSTFCVELPQPFADRVVTLLDWVRAWRDSPTGHNRDQLLSALEAVEKCGAR